ncbi:hypothetical protein QN397_25965 [Variovorax sp. RTB1]|uniref:hypothetical protein n=1 Tax=Variovorax sp. RTB1 TaxID=3048631 RepID=UPI002B226665|nr:hypothetical protein [Variovorax sp. RTB1]MEB0114726.1 hypothetical protein [Variovorax sp. RTB1]
MEKSRPNYRFEYAGRIAAVKLDTIVPGNDLRRYAELHLKQRLAHQIPLGRGFQQGSAAIAALATQARTYIDAQPKQAAQPHEHNAAR